MTSSVIGVSRVRNRPRTFVSPAACWASATCGAANHANARHPKTKCPTVARDRLIPAISPEQVAIASTVHHCGSVSQHYRRAAKPASSAKVLRTEPSERSELLVVVPNESYTDSVDCKREASIPDREPY